MGWGEIAAGLLGGDSHRQARSSDPRSQQMARVNRASRINRGMATTGKSVKSSLDGRGSSGEIAKQKENRGKQDWVEQSFGRPGKTAAAKSQSKKTAAKKSESKKWFKDPFEGGYDYKFNADFNSEKGWKDNYNSFMHAKDHPKRANAAGMGAIGDFLKGEAIAVKDGVLPAARIKDQFIHSLTHPYEHVKLAPGDDVLELDAGGWSDRGEDFGPAVRGLAAATSFTGLTGAAKGLAGKAAAKTAARKAEAAALKQAELASLNTQPIVRGLLGPGPRRMGPIGSTSDDSMVANAVQPMQQTRNVYTGVNHDLERGIFDTADQGMYPMAHAGDRTGWHPSDELGSWYQ